MEGREKEKPINTSYWFSPFSTFKDPLEFVEELYFARLN
jgi:hypothetical protein